MSTSAQTVAELAALGKLLHEHRPALLAMLERRIDPRLARRISAEDLLSEAFLEARRKWNWYKKKSSFSPYAWLYRICLDCLIAAWRRARRSIDDVPLDPPYPEDSSACLGLDLVNTGTSPSEVVARAELQARMRQAMEVLKPADREVLWMRQYDQLSFADIAQLLDIQENTASMRYVRALKKLEKTWSKLYPVTGSQE